MNKKLSESDVALEICNKLGIECCNGNGCCMIDGIEISKCMEPIEYKGYKTIPKLSVLDAVFMEKLPLLKIWLRGNRILWKELRKNFVHAWMITSIFAKRSEKNQKNQISHKIKTLDDVISFDIL